MDRLFSPWRYAYITGSAADEQDAATPSKETCVFCNLRDGASENDREHYILHRARYNFIVLNLYPYTSGHLLIVPYEHTAALFAAAKETTDELMDLAKRCEAIMREVYQPDGINLGMNLGRAAGAGVAAHLHLHMLPRWVGDANFMTTIGETRVLPEDLHTTFDKLKKFF